MQGLLNRNGQNNSIFNVSSLHPECSASLCYECRQHTTIELVIPRFVNSREQGYHSCYKYLTVRFVTSNLKCLGGDVFRLLGISGWGLWGQSVLPRSHSCQEHCQFVLLSVVRKQLLPFSFTDFSFCEVGIKPRIWGTLGSPTHLTIFLREQSSHSESWIGPELCFPCAGFIDVSHRAQYRLDSLQFATWISKAVVSFCNPRDLIFCILKHPESQVPLDLMA